MFKIKTLELPKRTHIYVDGIDQGKIRRKDHKFNLKFNGIDKSFESFYDLLVNLKICRRH
jgi:hypothetical protein